MNWPTVRWKPAVKNALTFGLALEVLAVGGGYYLYREYKTNEGKKEYQIKHVFCHKL